MFKKRITTDEIKEVQMHNLCEQNERHELTWTLPLNQ
jgi:hypothetical protein